MSLALAKTDRKGVNNADYLLALRVSVNFIEGLSTERVIERVAGSKNPQIILWYIGCHGLKEESVRYYKDSIISPILSLNGSSTFWLVDLTAWGAFHNLKGSVQNKNHCCEKLEKFLDGQIKCIRSSEYFKYIQKIDDLKTISYFKRALRRDFIAKSSQSFEDKNILVHQILNDKSQIMSDFFQMDVSKAYSAFQYFEGCWIVDQIFSRIAEKDIENEIELIFALPNDEVKYYKDQENSFENDLTFLIKKRCKELNILKIKLNVAFISVSYGSSMSQRPYNVRGKSLNSSQLSIESVCGDVLSNQNFKKQIITL